MPRYKLTLCYDGTRYRGWQKQGNTENTIQGKIEAALSRLLKQSVEVAGCGRTDAGVHAREQVCSFDAQGVSDPAQLLRALHEVLPEDIGALSLEEAPPRFHARLSCTEKSYVYRVWMSEQPNVFDRRCLLPHPEPLDLDAMRKAAALVCGRHDFSAFCSLSRMKKSAVRELRRVEITQRGGEVQLRFTGDGFLYHMVRILTGTLLEVGEGKRAPEELLPILASRERAQAGPTAPARGLTLWEIRYD